MIDSARLGPPIGILGGTFDPLHVGHVRLAIEAYEVLGLSAVRLVPLFRPNHRQPPIAAPGLRLEMLQRTLDGTRLVADDRELVRGGVSYTIDTLESLRGEFPRNPLCLLLGEDAFHGLCAWHRWAELLEFCHVVVVTRSLTPINLEPRLQQFVEQARTTDADILRRELGRRIYFQSIPLLPISSTDIRARIAGGRDISYLVPANTQRLIEQHQLYKSPA